MAQTTAQRYDDQAQGFDWQPRTGRLFCTEHGPDGPEHNAFSRGEVAGRIVAHHAAARETCKRKGLIFELDADLTRFCFRLAGAPGPRTTPSAGWREKRPWQTMIAPPSITHR